MNQSQSVKDFLERSEDFLNRRSLQQNRSKKIKIAVYGLMNAGKSYLLNMMTDHIQDEYFKTNDFRETTENKVFENQNFIYVDTPGLDANEDDDNKASLGIQDADIVLFVHQPQGELEAREVDFLKNLKKSFGKYAGKNIILVISKVDKESDEKINSIENKVLEQCNEIGFNPVCFQISGTRFRKGISENKVNLTRKSQVQQLSNHINEVAKNCRFIQKERALQEVKDLLKELGSLQEKLQEKKKNEESKIISQFGHFNSLANEFIESTNRLNKELGNI